MGYINGSKVLNVQISGLVDIDQTYNPESENPQSGKAVAEAFKNQEMKLLKNITLEESVIEVDVTLDNPVKEFLVFIKGKTDEGSVGVAVRTDGGSQYFCYGDSSLKTIDAYFYVHSKEIVERVWKTVYPKMHSANFQGIGDANRDARIVLSGRRHLSKRYVNNLSLFTIGRTVHISAGTTIEIWGVEANESI